ncbi:MAG: PTS fructose transporter subunit IIA [candidate division Zixibacteria bacterium]|nr:PTS fructose transporter subunit IIA [candidate division Zixibacteria bacterium]
MNFTRFLKPELIKLEMESTDPVADEDNPVSPEKLLWDGKEMIINELAELLDNSENVRNVKRLSRDLFLREKKASTGIGQGIAIPHVRTIQVSDFVIGFARSTPGLQFDTLDGEPAHLFFPMAAPPDDDTLYLRVFKELAEAFKFDMFRKTLMAAQDEYEAIRAFREIE